MSGDKFFNMICDKMNLYYKLRKDTLLILKGLNGQMSL